MMDRVYVMQLVRSFQVGEITRRAFLARATAALGSAAAANLLLAACQPVRPVTPPPVVAETATGTPAPEAEPVAGLTTGMVDYPDTDGETLMGYLARAEDGAPAPGVIVIQEWWGVDDHIKDVTNRFAQAGFVALAPDLYHGVVTTEPDEARKMVMALDMDAAVREIQQAISHLLDQAYVAGDKVGVVGFCMGGGLALRTGLADDRLGAAVAFYGSPLTPEEAPGLKAPLLGLYGEADTGIPVDAVQAMDESLTAAGIEHSITIYPGAAHAFFNDTRPSYHAEAATDGWQKTLTWFRDHLAA
jgi:carboxymethylenebutenolidase